MEALTRQQIAMCKWLLPQAQQLRKWQEQQMLYTTHAELYGAENELTLSLTIAKNDLSSRFKPSYRQSLSIQWWPFEQVVQRVQRLQLLQQHRQPQPQFQQQQQQFQQQLQQFKQQWQQLQQQKQQPPKGFLNLLVLDLTDNPIEIADCYCFIAKMPQLKTYAFSINDVKRMGSRCRQEVDVIEMRQHPAAYLNQLAPLNGELAIREQVNMQREITQQRYATLKTDRVAVAASLKDQQLQ
jgi:hypothetical protein